MASDGDVLRVLAGGEWARQLKWPSPEPPTTSWNGVQEVENDRVTKLWLGGKGLTGSIPPELGNLTHLTELYLYSNQLSGSIPPELGQLQSLQYLYLGENKLTGSIPKDLTNLRELNLWRNKLTGRIPPELGHLRSLQVLRLDENKLTGSIPPELGQLRGLTRLCIRNNKLTGAIPEELGELTSLTHLWLNRNQLSVHADLGRKIVKILENNAVQWAEHEAKELKDTVGGLFSEDVHNGWNSETTTKFQECTARLREGGRLLAIQTLLLTARDSEEFSAKDAFLARVIVWLSAESQGIQEEIMLRDKMQRKHGLGPSHSGPAIAVPDSQEDADENQDGKHGAGGAALSVGPHANERLSLLKTLVTDEALKIEQLAKVIDDEASFGAVTLLYLNLRMLKDRPEGRPTFLCVAVAIVVVLTLQLFIPIALILSPLSGEMHSDWFQMSEFFDEDTPHLRKIVTMTIVLLYTARFYVASLRKVHSLPYSSQARADVTQMYESSVSLQRCAIFDDIMDIVYEGFVYVVNLRVVMSSTAILDMVVNTLALEFIMSLDNQLKESYLYVYGDAVRVYMSISGIFPAFYPVTRPRFLDDGRTGHSRYYSLFVYVLLAYFIVVFAFVWAQSPDDSDRL